VDFSRHFKLSVNPAACLVDTTSSQSFATVLRWRRYHLRRPLHTTLDGIAVPTMPDQ
jgi:hypothetical protein